MSKRKYNFGQKYLIMQCRHGIAIIQGEQWHWLSDGYTRWLITDMNPETQTVSVKLWR